MPTNFYGQLMLSSFKRGALKKDKKIGIQFPLKKPKSFLDTFVVDVRTGEILSIKEKGNELNITAKIKKEKKKNMPKNKVIQMILKSIDFKRKNIEKLFTKMFYLNFTEQDLKRILKNKAKFELPKAFSRESEGEGIYLKVKNRYYEI